MSEIQKCPNLVRGTFLKTSWTEQGHTRILLSALILVRPKGFAYICIILFFQTCQKHFTGLPDTFYNIRNTLQTPF